ncbi:MAG: ADP-ribosylglycohydrolase family protein [Flavobacteriaceae bacterium]|nr:ADP-ribosylglycohydrolase family protein [Flavobacteriaceae bacterium]MDZ4147947.1 ADP-ribosylglycohydrolase family protein [Flavobacteriaceae bacterium]
MKNLFPLILLLLAMQACKDKKDEIQFVSLQKAVLKDKIAGGWAGKMIGVTYGAPTEFKAQGKIFEDSIHWIPADVKGSIWQDDIYVQLTFMETMDKYGVDAPAVKFQELFAKSGYMLWHANVQGRKNYFDGIYPPFSGNPEFSLHADDIDFQIESDYIGFICPGMPQSANKIADKIGHIMNYGDGVYGGVFVAALYAEAFLENDINKIINKALRSLPAESDYAKIINDVIVLHKQYPTDWREAWQELDNKWGNVNICEAGKTFNIDAKLNGAFIIMGLLYGDGDVDKTMEIATRCGQDSDCNPSNAVAVLGVIKGFSGLPLAYQTAVKNMGDSLFDNTSYSFNKAVNCTMKYAQEMIVKNGGEIGEKDLTIKIQNPVAFPLEDAFPELVFDKRINVFDSSTDAWKTKGNWKESNKNQSKYSHNAGDEISLTFEGTGVSIEGNWVKDGGMADVFVDGVFKRTIDCYFDYAKQEHRGINIFHILNLPDGKHTVTLVVKGAKNPKSTDANIYVSEAVIYKTASKTNEIFKFSFQ